jgi:hypothetical protein
MTPSEINAFLVLVKVTKRRLADELSTSDSPCTEQDINKTINGHQPNIRIREKLSARFGMTVDEMFGRDFELAIQSKRKVAA